MAPKIFGILFIVFALGLALYFYRLDPIEKLGLDNITLPNIFSTSTAGKESPPAPEERPETYFVQPPEGPEISPSEIPEGFTLKELSPYFHKVRLSSVYPGSGPDYPGQISLYTSFENEKSVNVTGWLLKARSGGQYIPRAINVYDPSGLASAEDIYLKNGDILYLYTNTSAIGQNLRLNKCLGYLENVNQFSPSLPRNCPTPSRFEVSGFSGVCQDYILSFSYCSLPDFNNLPIPQNDYACRQYLDTINYRGCFEKHRLDPDFLDHEWRVWTGSQFLDDRHDRLLLLDSRGLLVDLYEY